MKRTESRRSPGRDRHPGSKIIEAAYRASEQKDDGFPSDGGAVQAAPELLAYRNQKDVFRAECVKDWPPDDDVKSPA